MVSKPSFNRNTFSPTKLEHTWDSGGKGGASSEEVRWGRSKPGAAALSSLLRQAKQHSSKDNRGGRPFPGNCTAHSTLNYSRHI